MLSHHGAGALEAPAIVGNNAIVRSTDSPVASTNPLPTQIQPSPVEMEHVSTTPDIAKSGPSEYQSHLVEIVSQRLSQTATTLVDGRYLDHDTLS